MHAVRHHEFGPSDVLRWERVADPAPGPGQVRIAVEAAGVHLVDTALRAGRATGPFPLPELPMVPGREVAGVVDALGPGLEPAGESTWLGARVVAHLGPANGGYAELAVAPVAALHRLPDDVSTTDAVAMMGTGRMTQGLLALAELRPDDVVLVTSAAGGIGTLLVQAARAVGATVVGAAGGPDKVRRVRENGADVAVDYTDPGWADDVRAALGERTVTVVFDGVAGVAGTAAVGLLGVGGRVLVFGWSGGAALDTQGLADRGVTMVPALGPPILGLPGGLRALEQRSLADLAAGRLRPAVQTFPLSEAAAAHAALEGRATAGKVVLVSSRRAR